MILYSVSIFTIANNSIYRPELIEYIEAHENNKISYEHLKHKLQSHEQFGIFTGIEIGIKKEDPNDIYYWVTRFKDDKINYYKTLKPSKIGITLKKGNIYEKQMLLLHNLRLRFINVNPLINYYVIKINFPTNIGKTYYKNITGKWQQRQRDIINGEPGCINIL